MNPFPTRPLATLLMLATLFVSNTGLSATVVEHTIARAEWPEFPNGANLSALRQLQDVLRQFDERDGIRVEIRFPGGAAGERWARQLQSWFVAYGVPSKYLTLATGSGAPDRLLVMLVSR